VPALSIAGTGCPTPRLENPQDNVFWDRVGLELPDCPAASDALVDFHVSPLEDLVATSCGRDSNWPHFD
jgi:hypothetical protein